MRRDKHQKIAYGLRRVSRAVDRGIRADALQEPSRTQEKAKARAWVLAWAKVAKLKATVW